MKSVFGKLNWKDIRRGLALGLSSSGTFVFSAMMVGTVPDVMIWKSAGAVFVGTIGSYLLKNLFTNSNDQFLSGEGK